MSGSHTLGWFSAAIVPSLASLVAVPLVIYQLFPPGIKETPRAAEFASAELERLGPLSGQEKTMLLVLASVVGLWITKDHFHSIDTSIVALLGIAVLLCGPRTGVVGPDGRTAMHGRSLSGTAGW